MKAFVLEQLNSVAVRMRFDWLNVRLVVFFFVTYSYQCLVVFANAAAERSLRAQHSGRIQKV